jgi:NitT/TauT family transport system substrate-binding protein
MYRCLLLMLAINLMACTKKEEREPLRVGFNTWPGYEFIYLAQQKGLYQAQGLEVKLVELNSLGDVRRAMERAQIDVMASTLVEVIVASQYLKEALKIVAVTDASNGADVMLVPNEGQVKSVKDLAGKRLGMEGGTVDLLVSYKALQSVGLELKDLDIVGASQDDLVVEMESGRLDAMQTYPPYSIKLLSTGQYRAIFDTRQISGEIIDVISVNQKVFESRSVELQKFLKVYFEAVDYFEKNPHESAAIMGKREGITADEFIQAASEMQIFKMTDQAGYWSGDRLKNIIDVSIRALEQSGWIKDPIAAQEYIATNPHQ